MRGRVGTYNFSRNVLKPKIFSSEENNFYTVHCLSVIMVCLVLMLFYFLYVSQYLFLIDFPSNSQWDATFHCIAYGYSGAD